MVRRFLLTIGLCTLVPVLVLAAVLFGGAAARGALLGITLGVVAALVCTGAAVAYLVRRYQPSLVALRDGFQDLATTGFAEVPAVGRDDMEGLIQAFNRCAQRVRQQHANLQTLSEVDRLLLQPGGLEPVLDAILTRVQRVTGCNSTGIVLRDPDAPWRGTGLPGRQAPPRPAGQPRGPRR